MRKEILRLEEISCPGILDNFRLNIFEGEVLVLTGLIDSGLISVGDFLCGSIKAESGQAWFEEERVPLSWFSQTNKNSVFRFREECSLASNMTVAENIFVIHNLRSPLSLVEKDAINNHAREIFAQLNITIEPTELVGNLKIEDQRIIELIKAVVLGARLIILEDAWGSYHKWARESVFGMIGALRKKGISFLIITLRHEDTENIFDRMVLMSGGRNMFTLENYEYQRSFVYQALIGQNFYLPTEPLMRGIMSPPKPKEMIHVLNLRSDTMNGLSFTANSGKVLGLLDVRESCTKELVNSLVHGMEYTGSIFLNGRRFTAKNRLKAMKKGIGLIAVREEGNLLENLTWPENFLMAYKKNARFKNPVISKKMESLISSEFEGELEGLDPNVPLEGLDINEYVKLKMTYLKWIIYNPKVLICVKPCAFGDVVMRETAVSMIRQAAARGICVLVVSNDPHEITHCCDDVCILQDGKAVERMDRENFIKMQMKMSDSVY